MVMMEGERAGGDEEPRDSRRFRCPYCGGYDVGRLFVATIKIDSCACSQCGARWDEEAGTGRYRGRGNRSSVLLPRDR